jgi:hypothetical protein
MDEALAWGRKAVVACRSSVEVLDFRNANRIETPNPETRRLK